MALPDQHRLRRGADITATVRGGSRARVGDVVVHVRLRPSPTAAPGPTAPAGPSGPVAPHLVRAASVTPRAVGTAVVRNRVRRRGHAALLHVLRTGELRVGADVVVRYLPGSGEATVDDLVRALTTALQRAGVLARPARVAAGAEDGRG